jgi:methyl-accepting chemotaxis protein
MLRLKDISVGTQLSILSLVLFGAMVTVGMTGHRGISLLNELTNLSEEQHTAIRNMATVERSYDAVRAVVFRALVATTTKDEVEREEVNDELQTLSASLLGGLDALVTAPLEQDTKDTLAHIRPDITLYLTKAQEIVTLALDQQQGRAIEGIPQFRDAFTKAGEGLQELGLLVRGGTSFVTVRSEETAANATKTAGIVFAVATAIALGLGWAITRSITKPLAKMTIAASRIADGDIVQQIDHVSHNELGALAEAFRELIEYIQSIASAADTVSKGDLTVQLSPKSGQDILSRSFARMVDKLREMNGRIQTGTNVLSSSIAQILASVSQVAASTAATASTVSQTATTIEEVKHIARAANHKAKEITANSHQTASVSQSGEQALERAAAGMRRIREQMDSIADSVIKLGEQSQMIGNIIDAVNALAEQSSLLAVNAAIEAANAGEQGKGFAVVAREVKNLAGQSRQATAQVQNILNEIQKAAHIAVLVTEQGTKSVEVGVVQSLEAGDSIRMLSRNITEAAQAMMQIATSSEQQLLGIDQVAFAMMNVQRATTQNADGIRHIEGVTRDLQSLGDTLKELVAQYTLTRNGPR